MLKILFIASLVLNFTSVDREFKYDCNYQSNINTLEVMLEEASTAEQRAEVLWRLSRSYLMLGELEEDKEGKRIYFNKGIIEIVDEDYVSFVAYRLNCNHNVVRKTQISIMYEKTLLLFL